MYAVLFTLAMRNRKILIIEDDKKISDLVKLYLENEGFQTSTAYDGESGLDLFKSESPDFIVLDLMLPEIDGIEVAKRIRAESKVPILMLTAKSEEIDKILGLEIGADDYVTKPFSPKVLVARIKAILRRVYQEGERDSSQIIRIKNLEIDRKKYQVKKGDEVIHLSALEFRLLSVMASLPGQVFSRNQLMSKIYDNENEIVFDRTIDVHIKNIRKKLDDNPRDPTYIESVFGVGYRFREDNEN